MLAIRKCVVTHCAGDGGLLFRFPKDKKLCEMWKQNLKLKKPININYKTCVCQKHFLPNDVGKKKLKKGAIPVLHLGYNIDLNKAHKTPIKKRKNIRKCCVPNCTSSSRDSTLFCFPNEVTNRAAWLIACDVEDKKTLFVCEHHFSNNCKINRRLRKNAVPTINLNNSSADYNSDNENENASLIIEDYYSELLNSNSSENDNSNENFNTITLTIEENSNQYEILPEEELKTRKRSQCHDKCLRKVRFYQSQVKLLKQKNLGLQRKFTKLCREMRTLKKILFE